MGTQIKQEEDALQARRELLAQTRDNLSESIAHYNALHQDLRQQLQSREKHLLDLQVESENLDRHFEQRRLDHPQEVARIKAQKAAAIAEAARLQQAARGMRRQLGALQEESLLDFKA